MYFLSGLFSFFFSYVHVCKKGTVFRQGKVRQSKKIAPVHDSAEQLVVLFELLQLYIYIKMWNVPSIENWVLSIFFSNTAESPKAGTNGEIRNILNSLQNPHKKNTHYFPPFPQVTLFSYSSSPLCFCIFSMYTLVQLV